MEGDINIANTVLAGFVGTFIQCGGRSNLFLFTDPNDNGVVNMPFGIGDGTTTIFQRFHAASAAWALMSSRT